MQRAILIPVLSTIVSLSFTPAATVIWTGANNDDLPGTTWSDGLAPAPGNDYVVQNIEPNGTDIPTSAGGGAFGGDSLTVVNARVRAQINNGSAYTINNFSTAATDFRYNPINTASPAMALNGSWSIGNDTTISLWDSNSTLTINADLSGEGRLVVRSQGGITGNTLKFTDTSNDWKGSIQISSFGQTGQLDVDFDSDILGAASLLIGSYAAPSTNDRLVLDQNFSFRYVTLLGNNGRISLTRGEYRYDDLVAMGAGDWFVGNPGDDNVLYVSAVPEPSTLGLLVLATGFGWRRLRRFCRRT